MMAWLPFGPTSSSSRRPTSWLPFTHRELPYDDVGSASVPSSSPTVSWAHSNQAYFPASGSNACKGICTCTHVHTHLSILHSPLQGMNRTGSTLLCTVVPAAVHRTLPTLCRMLRCGLDLCYLSDPHSKPVGWSPQWCPSDR